MHPHPSYIHPASADSRSADAHWSLPCCCTILVLLVARVRCATHARSVAAAAADEAERGELMADEEQIVAVPSAFFQLAHRRRDPLPV